MFYKNIFLKKVICLILIISIMLYALLFIFTPKSEASYDSEFKKYPGYEELLKDLQEEYPNWKFEILETGLNWNDVLKNETTALHGRSLTQQNKSEWKCSCGREPEPGWYCASEQAVAYYMDPRNSLFIDYIFQFEKLTYDSSTQTLEGVEAIISDCKYLQGKIKYYDRAKGKEVTLDKTYAEAILEAGKKNNISPYHIASRMRQEQGTGDGSVISSGTWEGHNGEYKGYYNYFNIRATGETDDEIITNALKYAKDKGWTDPVKAIEGGAKFIAEDYIQCGQDTLYLQKYDVDDSDGSLYDFQYMTNIAAPKSEAESIREAYRDIGLLDKNSSFTFKIPVYEDMPDERSPLPGDNKLVTQNVEIKENGVNVRSGKGTNYDVVATLDKGDRVLRIEMADKKSSDGRYWDKICLSNGDKGYISREYLKQLNDITNCNEKYVVSDYTNFRNGPGIYGTVILKLLTPGQELTVIEKGVYNNVNGEDWYRVKLSDGQQGYVGSGYIEKLTDTSKYEQVKVVANDGVYVREKPTTSSDILTALSKGTVLTRVEKEVSTANNYIWDKITTKDGISGYVARCEKGSDELWIEPVNGESEKPSTSDEKFEISGSNLISLPNTTVEDIKKKDSKAVVKNGDKTISSGNVGTGYKVTYNSKSYTIIVLGDLNGDGKVNTGDTLIISQHIGKLKNITNSNYLKAADVNRDDKINTGDSLAMRQHIGKVKNIELK